MTSRRPRLSLVALSLCTSSLMASSLFAQQLAPTTRPDLATAAPGDVVNMPVASIDDVPTLPVTVATVDGPPLLFSDSPEYFPGDGIALREDFAAGRARFMIYHCPEATGRRVTITAVIENRGTEPMRLRFPTYSFPKPSLHYPAIGRQGMVEFLSNRPGPAERIVPPGGRVVLDEAMDATTVVKDELVHAFGELEASQPGRLIVLQRPVDARTLDVVDRLPTHQRHKDGAGRGTFPGADRRVTTTRPVEVADGPTQVVIADGRRDPWVTGTDAIGGDATTNKGNYGLIYDIRLTLRGDARGRRVAMLMVKPQEDAGYCPYTTAAVALRVGDGPRQVVALPREGLLRRVPPQAALIGIVAPPADGTLDVALTYTPPAASCLPTPILLVPID